MRFTAICVLALLCFVFSPLIRADEDAEFSLAIENAFKAGKPLAGDFLKSRAEVWEGECIHLEQTAEGQIEDYSFFGKSFLALERVLERGKRQVRFGYASEKADALERYQDGHEVYTAAEVREGDLTIYAETPFACGEGGGCIMEKTQMRLRKGKVFGTSAFIFMTTSDIFREEDKPRIGVRELRCYFSERVTKN
jgi:hypothetical protein